jgi:Lysyl oxidase
MTGAIRISSRLAIVLLMLASLAAFPSAGSAADEEPPQQLLPDLRTRRPGDLGLDASRMPGRRLLRFTNVIFNRGKGPLELGPKAEDCNGNGDLTDDRTAYQHVFEDTNGDGVFGRADDPTFTEQPAGCQLFHPAPDHNHWHFEDFARYELLSFNKDGTLGPVVTSSDKVSFCLFDTSQLKPNLPGFDSKKYYGTEQARCQQDEVTGISIGWSDNYSAFLEGQWVDVTGVPNGRYCLRSTADPTNKLLEIKDTNNARNIKLRLAQNDVHTANRRCTPRPSPSPE